jgi:hypothetical protein
MGIKRISRFILYMLDGNFVQIHICLLAAFDLIPVIFNMCGKKMIYYTSTKLENNKLIFNVLKT